ncbi:helix-turn-helix domain-containing protein [Riemerella anatipestifer]|nr:helix-turn-helix domain-containing protein [Riemerella anatipestifer]MDY3443429.1 helix-turn-helix domain-containing protein [Riemerella anatipestifer]
MSLELHIKTIVSEVVKPLNLEVERLKNKIEELGRKEFYTSKEICEMYSISRTTLWKLHNDKKINKYLIEGKTLYKKKEIDEVMYVC